MSITLVVPQDIGDELLRAALAQRETAGVLLARNVNTPGGDVRLLARAIRWVPDDAYRKRTPTALSIVSDGYVPALAAAEADQCIPIWLHTHPGQHSTPRPSKWDEAVDEELADVFRLRSGSAYYGAVTISPTERRLAFTGHIDAGDKRAEIDRLWITGRRLTLAHNWLQDTTTTMSAQFDRNIRAFGGEVQKYSETCELRSLAVVVPDQRLSSSLCGSGYAGSG